MKDIGGIIEIGVALIILVGTWVCWVKYIKPTFRLMTEIELKLYDEMFKEVIAEQGQVKNNDQIIISKMKKSNWIKFIGMGVVIFTGTGFFIYHVYLEDEFTKKMIRKCEKDLGKKIIVDKDTLTLIDYYSSTHSYLLSNKELINRQFVFNFKKEKGFVK